MTAQLVITLAISTSIKRTSLFLLKLVFNTQARFPQSSEAGNSHNHYYQTQHLHNTIPATFTELTLSQKIQQRKKKNSEHLKNLDFLCADLRVFLTNLPQLQVYERKVWKASVYDRHRQSTDVGKTVQEQDFQYSKKKFSLKD